VRRGVPSVLAGSIRDDGPIPDTELGTPEKKTNRELARLQPRTMA
jgi:hypothetical protein